MRSRSACSEPPRVGLIVSKSVGNSVVRHRVARRLRAVCSARLDQWEPGDLVVIRALPRSASASFDDLDHDVNRAADRLQDVSSTGARA